MDYLQAVPITASQIKTCTDCDPVLSKLRKMLLQGWQSTNDQALKPFQSRKNELSVQDDCILWGSHVLIPPQGHQKVIDKLHAGHPAIP